MGMSVIVVFCGQVMDNFFFFLKKSQWGVNLPLPF